MTAIVGGQQLPGGINIAGRLSTNFLQNQSYYVPANQVFKGYMAHGGSNSHDHFYIDGIKFELNTNGIARFDPSNYVEVGPGGRIQGGENGTYYLRGTLYQNT